MESPGPPPVRREGKAFYPSAWNCRSSSITAGTGGMLPLHT